MSVRVFQEPQDGRLLLNNAINMTHITLKGFQMGGFLSPLFLLAGSVVRRALPDTAKILARTGRIAIITALAADLLGTVRLGQSTADQNYDRSYRIWWNESQNRADRFAMAAAGAAVVGGFVVNSRLRALEMTGLASLGAAGGCLAHLASAKS